MYVGEICFGLFVDINDTLYCSLGNLNQVIAQSLINASNGPKVVAGTDCPGVIPDMLYLPLGIFVDINFYLYVADCGNDRIQRITYGNSSGVTVAGNGAPETISMNCPSGIVLDADNYLFIVDQLNNRIIGSGPNGYRCLVGCSGSGSASDQLNNPQSMSFDSYGNMLVVDKYNDRIQKFVLAKNSSGKYA
jgi:hypothetical protein